LVHATSRACEWKTVEQAEASVKLVRSGGSKLASNSYDSWLEPGDDDRVDCDRCDGDTSYQEMAQRGEEEYGHPCQKCGGKGWLPASEVEPTQARKLAGKTEELLRPILGAGLATDVANNAVQALGLGDDEIYEPDPEEDHALGGSVRAILMQRLRHPKPYGAEHLTKEMVEEAVAAVTEPTGGIKPNRSRASTLNGRASMDAKRVGRDVDPDRYTGKRGKDLDAAMDRYETFHAKRPLRAVELPHDLPTSVIPIGQVLSTMYRTDKWHEDGDDEDYKHVHDNSRGGKDTEYKFGKGVIAYEPAHQARKSIIEADGKRVKAQPIGKAVRLPVSAPGALSLLGYCLGVFVQRFDDEEVYELNPRGCYLFCSPKGDMLAVYSPDAQPDGSKGFLMIMAGGGLRVLKDGIDG
jgi:hypothetical protein